MGELDFSTGEKNPLTEYFTVVEAEGGAFQDFYFIVESFAQSIGFPVFPAVLDIAAPMPDGTGGRVDFLYF